MFFGNYRDCRMLGRFPVIASALEQAGKVNIDQPDSPLLMLAKLTAVNIIVCSLSIAILVAAGLVTVLLLFCSRRATLRQVNANLLQISEQVKQLRQAAGGASSAESGTGK